MGRERVGLSGCRVVDGCRVAVDYERLARDLAAVLSSDEVESARLSDDGGSVNLDSVVFCTDRRTRASPALEEALRAGGQAYPRRWRSRGIWNGYSVSVSTGGVAGRNTMVVEEVVRQLRLRGWDQFLVSYCMD